MSEPFGLFAGIRPKTVEDAERWLYGHGYHDRGDFNVQFGNGGVIDLRQVVADFAETYESALLARVHAWQKIAENAVNVNPAPPIITKGVIDVGKEE